jgi:hypothetical protein
MANDITDALIGANEFASPEAIKASPYLTTIQKVGEFIKSTINTISEMMGLDYRAMPGLTPERYATLIDGIKNDFINGFVM